MRLIRWCKNTATKKLCFRKGHERYDTKESTPFLAQDSDQYLIRQGVPLTETPWTSWTWKQYRDQVNAFGKALLSIGFERFDTINIMGFNSPEWFICNFGAMAAGGVASGIVSSFCLL
jgi:long-subunit acyl-CoA synthetase (AMP-forming)